MIFLGLSDVAEICRTLRKEDLRGCHFLFLSTSNAGFAYLCAINTLLLQYLHRVFTSNKSNHGGVAQNNCIRTVEIVR